MAITRHAHAPDERRAVAIPWFKVDDTLAYNAKAMAAGNASMGLWVRAGSWAMQQLTDGLIPDHIAASLGTRQEARRLVDAGLWTRVEGGYRFHQWSERQPSRAQVEADREANRKRQERAREAAREKREQERRGADVTRLSRR